MIPPNISKIWHSIRDSWDADHSVLLMNKGQAYGFTEKQQSEILKEAGFEIILKKKFMFRINNLTIAKKSK